MKYIVCRVNRDGEQFLDVPFVFPNLLVHSMVFSQMRALLENQYFDSKAKTEVVALSAGDIIFSETGWCSGKSESLGVVSRGELDDKLIILNDYGSGLRGM